VHERGDSPDGQRRAEAPREAQVLEISLPCAARVCEEQAIDQSGGHDWRCPVFRKVAFTMYPITDVDRARKFYEEVLGLKRGSMGNQGSQFWIEYDLPQGGCLALTNFIPDKPSDAAGGTIAFEVEDLEKLMADLKAKGVTFKSDVIHSPVCRMAVCLDSEGNSILLHQLKPKEKQ
jgi:predicted enzyme related to lactoylglutathione lyase